MSPCRHVQPGERNCSWPLVGRAGVLLDVLQAQGRPHSRGFSGLKCQRCLGGEALLCGDQEFSFLRWGIPVFGESHGSNYKDAPLEVHRSLRIEERLLPALDLACGQIRLGEGDASGGH